MITLPIPYTQDEFLELGFKALGDKTWRNSKIESQLERFHSIYDTSPRILSLIWNDLRLSTIPGIRIDQSTRPFHLLILYRWLKSYETENELKTSFGGTAIKTIRYWKKELVKKVANLRIIKIDPLWDDHGGLLLGRTVDGIHYPIDEPRPFNKSYSSFKLGGSAGLMYEYCICTDKPCVC